MVWVNPGSLIKGNRDASQSCLAHILRRLPLIPPPRDDTNVLTSEQKMLRDRHRAYLEYLVTGGRGKDAASPNDLLEIESFSQQFSDAQSMSADDSRTDWEGLTSWKLLQGQARRMVDRWRSRRQSGRRRRSPQEPTRWIDFPLLLAGLQVLSWKALFDART